MPQTYHAVTPQALLAPTEQTPQIVTSSASTDGVWCQTGNNQTPDSHQITKLGAAASSSSNVGATSTPEAQLSNPSNNSHQEQQQISLLLQNLHPDLSSPNSESLSTSSQQHSFVSHQLEMLRESLERHETCDSQKQHSEQQQQQPQEATQNNPGLATSPGYSMLQLVSNTQSLPHQTYPLQKGNTKQIVTVSAPEHPSVSPATIPSSSSSFSAAATDAAAAAGPSPSSSTTKTNWNQNLGQSDRNQGLLGQRVPVTLPKDIFNEDDADGANG